MKATVKKACTLIEFLFETYPDSPRTRIKKILQSGTLRVNGKKSTLHSLQLNPGDQIEIMQHEIKPSSKAPFPVLYEDNSVIVVDKPAGISTSSIDGSRNVQDSLSEYLKENSRGKERSYVVHRLDKEVSGVLLFAKSKSVMDTIKEKWEETDKHYYALVEGVPEKSEGTIKSWLIEDGKQKVHSTEKRENARLGITDYKLIKNINDLTLLDIKTHTGRKNQIRVHMSDLGCPIVGDRKYGASDEFVRRVRLHAYSLSFPHPVTGQNLTVQSPMPEGFLVIKPEDEKYK